MGGGFVDRERLIEESWARPEADKGENDDGAESDRLRSLHAVAPPRCGSLVEGTALVVGIEE